MKNDISIRAAVYLRAAELVEQGHCKQHVAERTDGVEINHNSPSAVRWCYVGAIMKARDELVAPTPNYHAGFEDYDPVGWNNHPDTTAAMVAAKLREQAFGD